MTTGTASHNQAGESSAAPVRAGELVGNKYRVERTLGVGGMGVVVLARDQVLDRQVAIKFLLPKLAGNDTAVQRFIREARAATRVTSEHVVRLLEIDKLASGTPFFVMEYLEGSDLRKLLRERGPLPPSRAVDYALQALQAVAEGHLKGIVHRDIKPGNLFLTTRADGTPLIKVLDFGIAKTLESDAAESTALTSSDDVRLGSPAYMPPEQLQNPRDVDTRSDIWSLGATLYELLCGRPPFVGAGYLELATHVLSSPPLPMSEQKLPGELPSGLEQVLIKCLQKDRNQRYDNAADLAAALAPFGSDDARISLTRVKGMWNGSGSLSAVITSLQHDSGSCATSLSVTGEASESTHSGGAQDGKITATIGPRLARRATRNWPFIAGACALVATVAVLHGITQAPPMVTAAAAPALTPLPAAPLVASKPTVTTPATPAASPVAAPVVDSALVRSAARERAPTDSQRTARKPRGTPSPSATPIVASSPPPLTASASDFSAPTPDGPAPGSATPGRSPEIERLIESRR